MTKIAIVIGSTRNGRVSHKLGKWIANEVSKKAKAETVDLADYPLDFFEEPMGPQYNPNRELTPEAKKWLDKIDQFDGYVLVTPEYNRSFSGILKNALDHIDFQFKNKPVALASHGSNNGAQAIDGLRSVIPAFGAVTIPAALYFTGRVSDQINEDGEFTNEPAESNPRGPQAALNSLADELIWYAEALKTAKNS